MNRFFKLQEHETTVRKEFFAGLATFFAMCYILFVNAGMFSSPLGEGENPLGVSFAAIYVGTAIAAIVGSLLMGLVANLPIALASAMGENAFFVYTICLVLGMNYGNALALTFVSGLLFLTLTITGLRQKAFLAIPTSVLKGITVGLGLLVALLGLKNSGVVVSDPATGLALGSFNVLKGGWGAVMPPVVTLLTFWSVCWFAKRGAKGAAFFGILVGTALYYLLGLTVEGFYDKISFSLSNPCQAFSSFGHEAFGVVFSGFDFSGYISEHGLGNFALVFLTTSLSLCMMDVFDTLGTLYATCEVGGFLKEDGKIPRMERAMLADSAATVAGSVFGVSTVSSYVESGVGIAEGGRTGLTSVFTALFFLVALFLSPLAQLVPGCATSACLIYVGVLMTGAVKDLDWRNHLVAVPAFMTLTMVPFTCNIAFGFAFGMISHVVMMLAAKRAREISPATWIVTLLFAVTLFLTH